jgi:hypothetical protein
VVGLAFAGLFVWLLLISLEPSMPESYLKLPVERRGLVMLSLQLKTARASLSFCIGTTITLLGITLLLLGKAYIEVSNLEKRLTALEAAARGPHARTNNRPLDYQEDLPCSKTMNSLIEFATWNERIGSGKV